jgi:hypothetical protein
VMSPAIGLLSLRELTAAEDSSDEAVHLIGLSPYTFGGTRADQQSFSWNLLVLATKTMMRVYI